MRSATSSTWRGSRPRTPPATSTGGGRFYAHLLHQRRVRMAVGDEAVLLLLGADEIPHLEIDMSGKPGLVVAERSEPFLQRDPVVARKLRRLHRPWRLEQTRALHQVGQVADGERV